jgi:hypothetical protein
VAQTQKFDADNGFAWTRFHLAQTKILHFLEKNREGVRTE